MTTEYFQKLFSEITKKCLDNNITDYKSCYEFHKFKPNDLLLEGIKKRYDMIETFDSIIKNCIDNNIDKTSCYYSKINKFDYAVPLGYFNEFTYTYNKIKINILN
jgi:hypothetical protein